MEKRDNYQQWLEIRNLQARTKLLVPEIKKKAKTVKAKFVSISGDKAAKQNELSRIKQLFHET